MKFLAPWLLTFLFGIGVFLIGLYLQHGEKKHKRSVNRLAVRGPESALSAAQPGVKNAQARIGDPAESQSRSTILN